MDALTAINLRQTPQSEPADPRQVVNSAGGYTFKAGDDTRVHRFLTIGTDGGTYYIGERELTKQNAELIIETARTRGEWLVERIVEVSTAGRAPRQNPAIFALAACAAVSDDAGRKAALDALPAVCRIGTHLFLFARYVEQFRGWGRGLRRAVGGWYLDKDVDSTAYQLVKYRQREGWSHRDLLRLAHPETDDSARRELFDWVCGRPRTDLVVPGLITAFEAAQYASTTTLIELIREYPLSWEMLPDVALAEPNVWRALIAKGVPQTALMRQLPRLTNLGVLDGDTLSTVTEQLTDPDRLRKARVHPINVLVALRTYASGRSARGDGTWTPKRQVIDALDAAFYTAFQTIEPAGKRTLLALDVSGSMGFTATALPITCREASAALALVTMATEPDTTCVGFTSGPVTTHQRRGPFGNIVTYGGRSSGNALTELPISPRQRLDDAIRSISDLPFGGTDCALPMIWAKEQGRVFDTIVILTDNETWAGSIHPHQALREYRTHTGVDTRLVVVGMAANDFTIADPTDPGQLDVAGFDSAVPNLISDFSRRSI